MSHPSTPTVPPDLITYRFGAKYVYVVPADSYEHALDIAQKEFPDELAGVARDRITFTITMKTSRGEHLTVRISESAWAPAVAKLIRGDVIDIQVRPAPSAGRSDSKEFPPPQYLEVPTSPPSSPSRSRSPSPSSHKGDRTNSNSRSWFSVRTNKES